MSTLPLILSEEPVTRSLISRMKLSKPNVAVVYSDAFGNVIYLGGRPLSWSEQVASKYRTRYEVDLSDQRRVGMLESSPLPSYGDRYFFQCMVDVGFRVTDPVAVVQRHVTDALVVIYNYIIDLARPVTRRHDIQKAQDAETEINSYFINPMPLPEGITIYWCRVRLLPDTEAQEYLRTLERADRTLHVSTAQHQVDVVAARQAAELAGIEQVSRLERETRELMAMGNQPLDLNGLIRMHLAKHPDETAYVTELLRQHELAMLTQADTIGKRNVELFRYMIDQGMVQSADVETLRKQIIGQVEGVTGAAPPAALPAASWDEPLSGRVIPVYVAIDESVTDQAYFEMLNDGMRRLPAELSGYPETSGAVRLAAIGYGQDVALRMPLTAVSADSFVPGFAHSESGSLGQVFEYLYRRIPQDVGRLKGQGLTLGRPTVHLLCGDPVNQEFAWEGAHRQLTDRASFSYAPNIIACGVQGASPTAISRVTTEPGGGWVASAGLPVADATAHYMAFVRATIVSLARAHASSSGGMDLHGPDGFRLAGGPV